jgi:hypothetical protein
MFKQIKTFLFGQRAQGELIQPPKIRTIYPTQMINEQQWREEFKFGNRYGHRGSFYQTSF